MKQILLFIFIAFSFELCARQIEEITFSYWDKPDSTVYFSTPESIDENTTIIFVMHGASRTARKYLNDWLPLAENRNVVLIAPEFSKESYPEYVYLMMATERGKLLQDQSLYLTDSLGLLFDFFKANLISPLDGDKPPTLKPEQSSILSAPALLAMITDSIEFEQTSTFILIVYLIFNKVNK